MIKKPHRKPAEDPSTIGGGLKARGRERRESLSIAIASAPRRAGRNDLLPAMELVSIPLKDLRFPKNSERGPYQGSRQQHRRAGLLGAGPDRQGQRNHQRRDQRQGG